MSNVSSIKALIDQFPTRRVLADEVDVNVERVHGWARNGSIPANFHHQVVLAANAHGIAITADDLDRLHIRKIYPVDGKVA